MDLVTLSLSLVALLVSVVCAILLTRVGTSDVVSECLCWAVCTGLSALLAIINTFFEGASLSYGISLLIWFSWLRVRTTYERPTPFRFAAQLWCFCLGLAICSEFILILSDANFSNFTVLLNVTTIISLFETFAWCVPYAEANMALLPLLLDVFLGFVSVLASFSTDGLPAWHFGIIWTFQGLSSAWMSIELAFRAPESRWIQATCLTCVAVLTLALAFWNTLTGAILPLSSACLLALSYLHVRNMKHEFVQVSSSSDVL
jgi:hypothetical protein